MLAYRMGGIGGCQTASNCTNCGRKSASKRMKAPLFPIWSQ